MAPPVAPSEHAGASGVCVASLGRGGLPWGIDGRGAFTVDTFKRECEKEKYCFIHHRPHGIRRAR